jgi:nucleotide-binding universal stress UspA family protein
MLYQSILLPIDVAHPETAEAMFEKANALLVPDGKMTVAYVVPDIPAYMTLEMPDGFLPVTMRNAEQTLRKAIDDAGVKAEVQILTGQAAGAILGAADTVGADLIIVSSHRPGLSDYLLGSTASRVVRHAQCAVLVIR